MTINGIGGQMPVFRTLWPTLASTTADIGRPAAVAPDCSTLAAAVREMAASPPADAAKIDRIRNELALGTYRIDPAAIAEKMIEADLQRG